MDAHAPGCLERRSLCRQRLPGKVGALGGRSAIVAAEQEGPQVREYANIHCSN